MNRKILFALILMQFFIGLAAANPTPYSGPDDPNAILAAENAVSEMGPEHGAIKLESSSVNIVSKSLDIKGVSKSTGGAGLALSADIRDAEKDLRDLGAKKSEIGYDLSLSGDVLFDFDKWDIKPEAEKILSKLADALKKLGDKQVTISGHTDAAGSDSYNMELSRKRAESVKSWLIQKGGATNAKISAQGLGESHPIAPNQRSDGSDNPEGRTKNRRVEIHIN